MTDNTQPEAPLGGRWYMVTNDGAATLCIDQEDAQAEAVKADRNWPHMGPHRAVKLVEASAAGFGAADMATAAAQGFRDGVASVAASAGSEPVAWLVCTEEGDPDMVFLSQHEAQQYLEDDERPTPLYTHPSPPEGAGWKWVPKILSAEMVDAWASARLPGGIAQMTDDEANRAVAQANWDSMIAAAPPPPAQAADSVLEDAASEVLMEHSGCGGGTQVDMLTVRLNPGDKVVMFKGPYSQAVARAAMAAKKGGE